MPASSKTARCHLLLVTRWAGCRLLQSLLLPDCHTSTPRSLHRRLHVACCVRLLLLALMLLCRCCCCCRRRHAVLWLLCWSQLAIGWWCGCLLFHAPLLLRWCPGLSCGRLLLGLGVGSHVELLGLLLLLQLLRL